MASDERAEEYNGTLYEWRGITADGKKTHGVRVGEDPEDLHLWLNAQKIVPYYMKPLPARLLSSKATAFLLEQLALLLQAGLAILDALRIVADGRSGRSARHDAQIYMEIHSDVESGLALSASLARHLPRQRQLPARLIRLGESSGNLGAVLRMLVADLQKEASIKKNLVHASIYPGVIILTSLAVTLLMTTQIIPAFKELYAGYNATLPEHTRITIMVSDFIVEHGVHVAAAVCGGSWLLKVLLNRSYTLQRAFSRLRLHTPLLRSVYRAFVIRQFVAAMALTYRAGMPVSDAIRQLGNTFEDITCRETLSYIEEQIRQGAHLHTAVARTRFFPKLVTHMLRVGETSGRMDEALEKLESHYSEHIEHQVKRFMQWLEPGLLFLVAGLVCWLVVSMYSPLFNLGFAL